MKYENVKNCPECNCKPDIILLGKKTGMKSVSDDVTKKRLVESRESFLKYQGYVSYTITCMCDNFTDENFIKEGSMYLGDALDKWNKRVEEYSSYKKYMVDTNLSVE